MKEILEAYADLRKERDELALYKIRADFEFKRLLPLVNDQPNLAPPGSNVNISQLVETYIRRLEAENKRLKQDANGEEDCKINPALERAASNGVKL